MLICLPPDSCLTPKGNERFRKVPSSAVTEDQERKPIADVDGVPLDLDGVPLRADQSLDGVPFRGGQGGFDGVPLNSGDLDGVPLATADIDGVPSKYACAALKRT